MEFLDLAFPSRIDIVRVTDYCMRVTLLDIHKDAIEDIAERKLIQGMHLEVRGDGEFCNSLILHAELRDLDEKLCHHLDVRRCWGLTKIEHWIAELKFYLGEEHEPPRTPWYAT
ncbi:MAG: hypothetical protein DRP83_02340, partial [Planctomycetota bacterium]